MHSKRCEAPLADQSKPVWLAAAQQLTDRAPLTGPAVSYEYDDRGSRTSSTVAASGLDPAATTTYGYDPTGAITAVDTPTADVEYAVDARGLRQSRTVGSSTDDFIWSTVSGMPVLLEDGDHTYLYGPSLTPLAQIDGTDQIEYLHGDVIGSVRTITDDGGAVAGVNTFDPFGARSYHYGSADSRFGYTGNWTDPDTGLVHLRARDYDPTTGQFLSVDPSVDTTKQPYAYTGNSPLLRTDPSGLDFLFSVQSVVNQVGQVAQHATAAGEQAFAAASACILDQVAAFAAGALDSFTFGLSSVVLGAAVPGYNDFVAGHEAAFTAGSIAVTVIQAAVAIVATAGAGAGIAVGLVALKMAAKTAIKAEAKAASKASERLAAQGARSAGQKTVVIGEDMAGRVQPLADRIGATTYGPNPSAPRSEWMQNNRNWINQMMDEGARIIDAGPAPGRPNFPGPSSEYYAMELSELARRAYQVTSYFLG